MQLNQEILDRLEKVLTENNLNKRQFALSIGAQTSGISEVFNGNIGSLSGTTVKILEVIYGINPIWLETGSGKQYKSTIVTMDEEESQMIAKTRKLTKENKVLLKALIDTLWLKQCTDIKKMKRAAKRSKK
ncbi:MAG: hypothetical protein ABUK01_12255 [Leptospirales bacterium]